MAYADNNDPLAHAKGVTPEFYMHKRKVKFVTERHPLTGDALAFEWRDQEDEYIKIRIHGDRTAEWAGKVNDAHRMTFPEHYRLFKSGLGGSIGTPLRDWAMLNQDQVLDLEQKHITTLEALAELGENAIPAIGMGGRALVAEARREIENRKGRSEAAQNAELRQQLADLTAMVQAMQAAQQEKRGPGRPPKDRESEAA